MKLEDFAAGSKPILLALIGGDKVLAGQIQTQLGTLGLLDPPADGAFGPVSRWALGQFLKQAGLSGKALLDAEVAHALLETDDSALFPINAANTLAGRIVQAMHQAGHWVARHPDCVNVVYIEGMELDGTPNENKPNEFNDTRLALRINRAGNPVIENEWEATTEPGSYYELVQKLDPKGAARIAFGQYKAWSVGTHKAGTPGAHEALVQTAPIDVYRDLNGDFKRMGDREYTGLFGIDQHWGYDLKRTDIGKASAGCLVGRTKTGHREFMALCKADPRFSVSNGYRFMTAILPAQAL
jgi:hypothetical protein